MQTQTQPHAHPHAAIPTDVGPAIDWGTQNPIVKHHVINHCHTGKNTAKTHTFVCRRLKCVLLVFTRHVCPDARVSLKAAESAHFLAAVAAFSREARIDLGGCIRHGLRLACVVSHPFAHQCSRQSTRKSQRSQYLNGTITRHTPHAQRWPMKRYVVTIKPRVGHNPGAMCVRKVLAAGLFHESLYAHVARRHCMHACTHTQTHTHTHTHTRHQVVPLIGEDPAAYGYWYTFTDLSHTMPPAPRKEAQDLPLGRHGDHGTFCSACRN